MASMNFGRLPEAEMRGWRSRRQFAEGGQASGRVRRIGLPVVADPVALMYEM